MQILELKAGRLRAALRPDLGGALAGLWFDGEPVLRGMEPKALRSIDDAACFACAPFTQELGNAKLRWMKESFRLPPHPQAAPHALHGVAWRRPWEPVIVAADGAMIRYRHGGDEDWPFAFEIEHTFKLTETSLVMQLRLGNLQMHPQPAGIGWQFAVPKRADSRIQFNCRERWDIDSKTRLPCEKSPQEGLSGRITALDLDHAYEGWSGALRLREGKRGMRIKSSLDRLAVSSQGRADHLRIGPVSHAPDAFHMGSPTSHGLEVLPVAASIEAWVMIDIDR